MRGWASRRRRRPRFGDRLAQCGFEPLRHVGEALIGLGRGGRGGNRGRRWCDRLAQFACAILGAVRGAARRDVRHAARRDVRRAVPGGLDARLKALGVGLHRDLGMRFAMSFACMATWASLSGCGRAKGERRPRGGGAAPSRVHRPAPSMYRAADAAALPRAAVGSAAEFIGQRLDADAGRGPAAGSGCNGQVPFEPFSGSGTARGSASRPAGGRGVGSVARRRDCAHDIGFDHDVGRAADHQQMLDIVAPDQNAAAAGHRRVA